MKYFAFPVVVLTMLNFGFDGKDVQNEKKINSTIDNTVVTNLDLERYLGKWYEIARFDHRFERGLSDVTAEYSLRKDGLVKVINSGLKNGKVSVAKGKARIPDKSFPAKLQVSFFLFFWGDYYIMELADDYRYSLVGSSSDKYLWILSRTPELSVDDKNFLLQRIRDRGYDENNLIWLK